VADVGSVSPIFQLVGTVITVAGGIIVAIVARGGPNKKEREDRVLASHDQIVKAHTDILLLIESVNGLKTLLLDYWQWSRDREASARERFEWMKENFR
jgi:hypothetical protein